MRINLISFFNFKFCNQIYFFSIIIIAGIFSGCETTYTDNELESILVIEKVDPLEKIFRETSVFHPADSIVHAARGEHATIQIAVRSQLPIRSLRCQMEPLVYNGDSIKDIKIGYVDYVRVGRNTPNQSRDKLYTVNGHYPDPIVEQEEVEISPDNTQPVWITIAIPVDIQHGLYESKIKFTGQLDGYFFTRELPVAIQVYPVIIDETSLWVTNWYSMNPYNLELVFGEKNIPQYSEKYWEFVRLLAAKMADYRQNVAIISPLRLAEYFTDTEGRYTVDFDNFDRTVDIFIEEGVVGRIEGGHIGTREGGWLSDFVVFVPSVEQDTTIFKKMSIRSDSARQFYSQFIPVLTRHLKEKGWDQIYMQHLMDEPIPENIETYVEVAQFVNNLAPDLKIVEACHSKDLDNTVNIWVPQLDYLHLDYEFYQERSEAGDEIWFYTCLNPKGEYANRFIELPLIKTRILHWINFRYQVPGYLHWGFNFWRGDPYDETTSIQLESGTILPGGDAWIVYPGEGKLNSSIRLEAMRDGIVDYELLKLLSVKDPELAAELARQVVYRFDYYDINIEAFRKKRRLILETLSR